MAISSRPAAAGGAAWAAGVGLALTAAQVLLACLTSGRSDPRAAYLELVHGDSCWFGGIVSAGYFPPDALGPGHPGNTAFFPGYPCAVRLVQALTGLPLIVALPLTAQLSCWGFWVYLLLLCRRWGASRGAALAAAALLALQPGAFFMVSAYSESLLLFGAFGFVYWSERDGPGAAALGALHGVVMTAARFVGLALLLYPVARALLRADTADGWGGRGRRVGRALLIAAAASLGGLGYFAYCQLALGDWNLFSRSHAIGWDVHPRYLALFTMNLFRGLPRHLADLDDPGRLSRLTTAALAVGLLALLAVEAWRVRSGGWRQRLPAYLCAFLLFWTPASAFASHAFNSMIRFALPVLALLLPTVLHLRAQSGRARAPLWARALLAAWLLASLGVHLGMAWRYTHNLWVA
jgi:hypothetical protein